MMTFASIPSGSSVFIDANVFVYAFAADPVYGDACTDFLERVEIQDLQGFVSTSQWSEVAHRLMTLEACDTFGWPYKGIGQRLRKHPAEIKKLHRFRQALDTIAAIGVQVLAVDRRQVLLAGDLSQSHGLLSGDALAVASMQTYGFTKLASNDADFDLVPSITRFAPN